MVEEGLADASNNYWFAIHTRHQHEKIIARVLSGKGFEVFLPLYTAVHRWKDRRKLLSLPLFSCYVFVRNPVKSWLPVVSTPGVYQVVGFGGNPSALDSSEIEVIRRMSQGSVHAEPHPFLHSGDRVRLIEGPLQGLEGILVRKKSVWKLLVSVEILQRSVAVEIDSAMVEPIRHRSPQCLPHFSSLNPAA